MIPALQKITILALVLLQFAAPLVHAHTGMEIAGPGVHVPGLESWSVGAKEDSVSSSSGPYRTNNCLVAISSAIQQKQPVSVEPFGGYALSQPPVQTYVVSLDVCLLNFSPHRNRIIPSPLVSSHATRAPPFSAEPLSGQI